MSDSNVTIVGNLTRDPELRFGANGGAVLALGIAVNKKKKVGDDWEEKTSFFNAVAFGTLAENAAASLSKGNRVIFTGEPEQREYETKEGEKRNVTEFVINAIGPDLRWATADITKVEAGGATTRTKTSSSNSRSSQPAFESEEPF